MTLHAPAPRAGAPFLRTTTRLRPTAPHFSTRLRPLPASVTEPTGPKYPARSSTPPTPQGHPMLYAAAFRSGNTLRITLPKAIRLALALTPGTRVVFDNPRPGVVEIRNADELIRRQRQAKG